MDAIVEYWGLYKRWAHQQETVILDFFDPAGAYKLHPMQDYPLADFSSVLLLIIAYLAFVCFGSLIMKAGVPAFNTSPLQFIYNPIQVILCSYMAVETLIQAYRHSYSFIPCNAYNAKAPVMGNVLYIFYLSKLLDFMDTFFIILGKKWKQLSFLHVYHHASVFFVYFVNYRALYDGEVFLSIMINSFIHTIMYTYYFVSSHTKNIWWKKYLTAMQMIQFMTLNVHGFLIMQKKCSSTPYRIIFFYLIYSQTLFWLFMNFFIRSYCCTRPRQTVQDHTTKKIN